MNFYFNFVNRVQFRENDFLRDFFCSLLLFGEVFAFDGEQTKSVAYAEISRTKAAPNFWESFQFFYHRCARFAKCFYELLDEQKKRD